MHEHVRRRLDLGFLRRAVLSQASRPEALGPALRRCCEHILEQPASLTAFLETLDATALEGGITRAPRAFTALSEAFAIFAGPHARPRGSALRRRRVRVLYYLSPLHKSWRHHCHVSKNLSSALVSTETPRAWTQRSWSEVQPSNRPGDSTIMCWITLFPELEPEGFYP